MEILQATIPEWLAASMEILQAKVVALAQGVEDAMYSKLPAAERPGVKFIVDKMLFNFRNIGFIHVLFPRAKIIHTVRGFWDLLHSNYKYKFEDTGLEWSFSVPDLVHFFACYRRGMRHCPNAVTRAAVSMTPGQDPGDVAVCDATLGVLLIFLDCYSLRC